MILSLSLMGQQEFPSLLRAWRNRRKFSQERLGAAIGGTQGLISQYESGETEVTLSRLYQLAEALRCRPSDLLERTPEEIDALMTIWDALDPSARKYSLKMLAALRNTATE